MNKARLIAFYLPQFHPIPENDKWWGKGFTEWSNVAKAKPLFRGHYQPHIPADLGFYDLRLPEVREAQVELAKEYGIYGFCYYHYWFNGKRLLERPFNEVLSSGKPDFPFCLCWANENWTRRWDGKNEEVLLCQKYSFKDDKLHINYLSKCFVDKRYIRIDNKPLFLVYRPELLPDPKRTIDIWRSEALRSGIGELFLANVHSLGEKKDPIKLGFDASVEFAPDWPITGNPINRGVLGVLRSLLFYKNCLTHKKVLISDYRILVRNMIQKEWPSHTFFRCVCPSWDNVARRKNGARVFVNNNPELFADWLKQMIEMTKINNRESHQYLFVNAWNEWAEGCHLEPCQKYGRAYLNAIRKVLLDIE